MRLDRMVVRFIRLGWRRQMMLGEALGAITAASLAVRFQPFEQAVRAGALRLPDHSPPDCAFACGDVQWSVVAVATRVPWRAVCFQQGLALQWMLRRRGIEARLHYGVGKNDLGDLGAHVWVSVGQAIVIGGEEAPKFRAVAVYP